MQDLITKHLDRAWKEYLARDYSAAKSHLDVVLKAEPNSARAHLLLGWIYLFDKKPEIQSAIEEFRQVISLSPLEIDGYVWLGGALKEAGDLAGAIEILSQAKAMAPPGDSRAHLKLGVCLLETGRVTEALPNLQLAASLEVGSLDEADVRYWLAEALAQNGQLEEACAEWRKVIEIEREIEPNSPLIEEGLEFLRAHSPKT